MANAVFYPPLSQVVNGVLPGNGQDELKLVFSVSLSDSELAQLAGAVIEVWSNIPTYEKSEEEWGATPFEEPDEAPGATRLSGFDQDQEPIQAPLKRLFATFTVPARPTNYSFTYRIRYPEYYQWLGQSWNNGTIVIPAAPAFVRTHEPTGIAGLLSPDVAWKGWAWKDEMTVPPMCLSSVDHIQDYKTVLLAPSSTFIPDLPLILLQSSLGIGVKAQIVTSLDVELRVTLLQEVELQTCLTELGSNFLSNPGMDWIAFTSTRWPTESYKVYPRSLMGTSSSVVLETELVKSLLPPNIESYAIVSEESDPKRELSPASSLTPELDIGTHTVVGLRSVPGSDNLLVGISGAATWVETAPVSIPEPSATQSRNAEPPTSDHTTIVEPDPPTKVPDAHPTPPSGFLSEKKLFMQPVPTFSRFLQDSRTPLPSSFLSSVCYFIMYILALLAPFFGHYIIRIGLGRFARPPTPIMPTSRPQPTVTLPQEADDTATESVDSASDTPDDSAKPDPASTPNLVGKAKHIMNSNDHPRAKEPALVYEVTPENGVVNVLVTAKKSLPERPRLEPYLDGVLATVQSKELARDVWILTLSREKLGPKSLLEISIV